MGFRAFALLPHAFCAATLSSLAPAAEKQGAENTAPFFRSYHEISRSRPSRITMRFSSEWIYSSRAS